MKTKGNIIIIARDAHTATAYPLKGNRTEAHNGTFKERSHIVYLLREWRLELDESENELAPTQTPDPSEVVKVIEIYFFLQIVVTSLLIKLIKKIEKNITEHNFIRHKLTIQFVSNLS